MRLALQGSEGLFLCEFAAEGKIQKNTPPSLIYFFTLSTVHLYFLLWFGRNFFGAEMVCQAAFCYVALESFLMLLR